MRAFIFYALSIISLIVALVIFFKWLDFKSVMFLTFGIAAILLFRQGVVESRKK